MVYVDDILVTGNLVDEVQSLINQLHLQFSFKDLSHLKNFFGIEMTYISIGIHLCQVEYIKYLLPRVGMTNSNSIITSMVFGTNLKIYDGVPLKDPSTYISVVGDL